MSADWHEGSQPQRVIEYVLTGQVAELVYKCLRDVKHLTCTCWALQRCGLEYFQNLRKRLHGLEVLQLQRAISVERCFTLRCHSYAPTTKVIAILFPELCRYEDWHQSMKENEVNSSRSFFTVCLILVAIECVLFRAKVGAGLVRCDTSCVVLVTAFHLTFLKELRCFLEQHLQEMCTFIHTQVQMCTRPDYVFAEWMQQGWLRFEAAQRCHHIMATAVFGFWGTRRLHDTSYDGDQTERHLIYAVTTNASERLYIVMEDLHKGISVPYSSSLLQEAARLGLQYHQLVSYGNIATARKQLRLVELYQYLATLRNCYDSSSKVGVTSWYRALLNDAYRRSIYDVDPAVEPLSWGLSRQLLCVAESLARRCYDNMHTWSSKTQEGRQQALGSCGELMLRQRTLAATVRMANAPVRSANTVPSAVWHGGIFNLAVRQAAGNALFSWNMDEYDMEEVD